MWWMSVKTKPRPNCWPTSPACSRARWAPTRCPPVCSALWPRRTLTTRISPPWALACEEKGFACLRNGLRNHLAGIDVGLSRAELGVAGSGTCMMNTDNEDVRLAGMISEIHVILLRKSDIYPDLPSIAQLLRERMNAAPATYTTLITGPSRTADIERVGAVGVHGPLELHIILLED